MARAILVCSTVLAPALQHPFKMTSLSQFPDLPIKALISDSFVGNLEEVLFNMTFALLVVPFLSLALQLAKTNNEVGNYIFSIRRVRFLQ